MRFQNENAVFKCLPDGASLKEQHRHVHLTNEHVQFVGVCNFAAFLFTLETLYLATTLLKKVNHLAVREASCVGP